MFSPATVKQDLATLDFLSFNKDNIHFSDEIDPRTLNASGRTQKKAPTK
jgi:hypothetical protein